MSNELQKSFVRILTEDVQDTLQRVRNHDTPINRRNAVRNTFAAIEGVAWMCRNFVRDTAIRLDVLDPVIEMALREETYFVTSRGKVETQTKYIAFAAMFKLVSRLVESMTQHFAVDFSGREGSSLLGSLDLRNRLMHPKSSDDLLVSMEDVHKCEEAFHWILETCSEMMLLSNFEVMYWTHTARQIMRGLADDDPKFVAEYEAALAAISND